MALGVDVDAGEVKGEFAVDVGEEEDVLVGV